jgi:hypothetical protein
MNFLALVCLVPLAVLGQSDVTPAQTGLQLHITSQLNHVARLSFPSEGGVLYQIQTSPVPFRRWLPLNGAFIAQGSATEIEVPLGAKASFYRVVKISDDQVQGSPSAIVTRQAPTLNALSPFSPVSFPVALDYLTVAQNRPEVIQFSSTILNDDDGGPDVWVEKVKSLLLRLPLICQPGW